MNIEFLRTAKKSYMIVKDADYPFEQYELKMIQHNTISCLLEFQIIITDGKVEYWYDVTGMQSLEKQYSFDAVGKKQLQVLLQNLIDMKSAMEEYLLDDADICFSLSMIFYDRFSEKLRFCFIPGFREQKCQGLQKLFEEILQQLDHSDPAAVNLGYEMYERCVQSEFVISDCVECLRMCADEQKPADAVSDEGGMSGLLLGDEGGEFPDAGEEELEFLRESQPQKRGRRRKGKKEKKKFINYRKILEDEREVLYTAEALPDIEKTELFSAEDLVRSWELVYKGDGLETDIRLTEFPFLVGTDSQKVIGVLQSRAVSRVHAGFFLKEGKLYLEDYNSTNGTYLNQKLVPMNTPMEVHEGDRIVFATEEYAVFCRWSAGGLTQKR
ncbi:MAG: FHA domain-containing protein [Clostridiales bacterium]|nr:FHA domain-containing protein [Clostridiales bacterium]